MPLFCLLVRLAFQNSFLVKDGRVYVARVEWESVVVGEGNQYPSIAELNDAEVGEGIHARLRRYQPWLRPTRISTS